MKSVLASGVAAQMIPYGLTNLQAPVDYAAEDLLAADVIDIENLAWQSWFNYDNELAKSKAICANDLARLKDDEFQLNNVKAFCANELKRLEEMK